MKRVEKRTKIIATVGPACRDKNKLWELYKRGADIFRLNFSHGSHEDHMKVINWINELNEEHQVNICTLQDLQGPKIRTTEVENNGVEIKNGDKLQISIKQKIGNSKVIGTTYKALVNDVNKGDTILIDDGNLELKVLDKNKEVINTEIIYGGILKSRKGINLPNTKISEPSLTPKDREDLEFGLENDVDWIALSFVRTAQDIIELKEIIDAHGRNTKVIAKIEKPEAVANIDEIIAVTDAIMVARGDLGVEVEMEKVPLIQKEIVKKCNKLAKPVIIATQMLESMITNPRPTRAEANDVANAILDGADVVMLSAESASGDFPNQAVESMSKIITEIESKGDIYDNAYEFDMNSDSILNDSVVAAACNLARRVNAKAIIGRTNSGYTGLRIASHRPKSKIFVFTDNKDILTRLSLVWGVTPIFYNKVRSLDDTINDIKDMLVESGDLKKGDVFINTGSTPVEEKLKTNMLKLSVVE